MAFTVAEVIDGDTFRVGSPWYWLNQKGDIVRVNGYHTPEQGQPGYDAAKEKLKKLILGKTVELKDVIKFTHGRLLCNVYVDGKNLADYFKK
jgi:endonuclease YncB( thermonuclease family)